MDEMIINFLPSGAVEHTLKDGFFNPLPGAHRSVERMSNIPFDEGTQRFYIEFSMGEIKGEKAGPRHGAKYGVRPDLPRVYKTEDTGGVCRPSFYTFSTYEAAVKYEVDLINAMRLTGVCLSE